MTTSTSDAAITGGATLWEVRPATAGDTNTIIHLNLIKKGQELSSPTLLTVFRDCFIDADY